MEKNILDIVTEISEKQDETTSAALEAKAATVEVKSAVAEHDKRLDMVETMLKRPATARGANEGNSNEYVSKFVEYALDARNEEKKAAYEALTSKAVTAGALPDAKPRTVSDDIIAATREVSPFADLVLRKNGISPDFSQTVSNGVGYELVGEETDRSILEANYGSKKPVFTEITTTIRMSKQAIEDLGFNLVGDISAQIGQTFGVGMERYLVNGTGTGVQNAGILLGGTAVNAAGPDVTVDEVLALMRAVKVGDAQMGAFVVSPAVYEILSNEKISGQRIIDIKDTVDVIRGKPVYQSEWLPASTPVLFGNFRKGFLAGTHVAGVDLQLNPFKKVGFVDFEARMRFGSTVLHSDAYAKLVVA